MEVVYDRLQGYEEIVKCYGSLETALMDERLRGDRLEEDLNTLRNAGIKLRDFIQYRFDRLFSAFQHARQQGDDYEMVLGKQEDRLARIHDLEEEVDRFKTSLNEAISADLEKVRRDMSPVHTSLE